MTDDDAMDGQLSRAWQALSPPPDLQARVRARVLQAETHPSRIPESLAARRAKASRSEPGKTAIGVVSTRWRSLRASGSLGSCAGAVLLALGFLAGYWSRPDFGLHPAPSSIGVAAGPPSGASASAGAAAAVGPIRELAGDGSSTPELPSTSSTVMAPARAAEDAVMTADDVVRERRPLTGTAARSAGQDAPVQPRTRAHAPARTDGQELLLLERAERAVRARNPALALSLSAELEERYPRSRLHEERRAIELMARCQAGSADDTRRERFAREYPTSVYAGRIAGECGAAGGGDGAASLEAARAKPKDSATRVTKPSVADMDRVQGGQHVQTPAP